MQAARAEWTEEQPQLDVTKLVFLDETGLKTNMTRLHGRAPRGERCHAHAPGGHWHTTTFTASLRVGELTAPMLLDGAMDGEAFLVYVRDFLCPTLKPGDIVIADNLKSHKVKGVKEAVEAVGATIRYLPPYSPDLNPIENLFSKLKSLLRKAAKRTVDELWKYVETILGQFPPHECQNYFKNAGYTNI